MHLPSLLHASLLLLSLHLPLATAGPSGHLQLANLTPYNWTLTYTHSYQMRWSFPATIAAGTTHTQNFEYKVDHGPNGDCGAEATYTLLGSPEPASFTVQARQKKGKRIEVQYGGGLASIGNPVGSLLDLGFVKDGTVLFVLAGNETGRLVGSGMPVAWMQATLDTIGEKSLREISMPTSHDAGMSQVTRWYGGVAHNTVTQSVHVYQQLVYGARWFDVRPVLRKGKWYTNHMTGRVGTFGRTMNDIVKDVNRFTRECPGELVVLDLSHEMDRLRWRPRLTAEKWQILYDLLYNGLQDIWMMDQSGLPEDLSEVPIQTFIKPGSKSAVLVRVPDHAPAFIAKLAGQKRDTTFATIDTIDDMPIVDGSSNTAIDEPLDINAESIVPGNSTLDGSDDDAPDATDDSSSETLPDIPPKPPTVLTPAFLHARRLSTVGEYSDTDSASYLEKDQLLKLSKLRSETKGRIHQSTWTITQRLKHILDAGNPAASILSLAVPAHRKLFEGIWKGLSRTTWPNLIEVDDIRNNQVAALCVAINGYFGVGMDLNAEAGKRLGKRAMAFKGRAVDELVVVGGGWHEWLEKKVEGFLKVVWCSLKIERDAEHLTVCWNLLDH
ncbi:hypothetical protein VTL71DRAFT_10564 [Oculimacula yallundae]|uniref:PLC-like phosphodiesterase n=1 Tax=Oculimacula yallundae TaxID=86028 RepID=A0ABR4CTQ9_9HELO